MAMTLRLSPERDELLGRLARDWQVSKNIAAAEAIEVAAPRRSHPEFVASSTSRLLERDADLLSRLSNA